MSLAQKLTKLSKSLKSLMENLSNPKRKSLNHYWTHDHGARVNQKSLNFNQLHYLANI